MLVLNHNHHKCVRTKLSRPLVLFTKISTTSRILCINSFKSSEVLEFCFNKDSAQPATSIMESESLNSYPFPSLLLQWYRYLKVEL